MPGGGYMIGLPAPMVGAGGGAGAELFDHVAKSGDYTIVSGDKGKTFVGSGTIALTLPAPASKFWFAVLNNGSGLVTVGNLIRLEPNEWVRVGSDGSSFFLLDARLFHPLGSPDRPPLTPHAEDDEFNGTSVAGAWTETTAGTETPDRDQDTTQRSHYWLKWLGTGGASANRELEKASDAGTSAASWTAHIRQAAWQDTHQIFLAAAASGGIAGNDVQHIFYRKDPGSAAARFLYRDRSGGVNADTSRLASEVMVGSDLYLHLQRNNGNAWEGWVSADSMSWARIGTATRSITVAKVGLRFSCSVASALPIQHGIDWFRRNWITL
jgi:hypothetical protein